MSEEDLAIPRPALVRSLPLRDEAGRTVYATLTSDPKPGLILGFGMTAYRLPPAELDRLRDWLNAHAEGRPPPV